MKIFLPYLTTQLFLELIHRDHTSEDGEDEMSASRKRKPDPEGVQVGRKLIICPDHQAANAGNNEFPAQALGNDKAPTLEITNRKVLRLLRRASPETIAEYTKDLRQAERDYAFASALSQRDLENAQGDVQEEDLTRGNPAEVEASQQFDDTPFDWNSELIDYDGEISRHLNENQNLFDVIEIADNPQYLAGDALLDVDQTLPNPSTFLTDQLLGVGITLEMPSYLLPNNLLGGAPIGNNLPYLPDGTLFDPDSTFENASWFSDDVLRALTPIDNDLRHHLRDGMLDVTQPISPQLNTNTPAFNPPAATNTNIDMDYWRDPFANETAPPGSTVASVDATAFALFYTPDVNNVPTLATRLIQEYAADPVAALQRLEAEATTAASTPPSTPTPYLTDNEVIQASRFPFGSPVRDIEPDIPFVIEENPVFPDPIQTNPEFDLGVYPEYDELEVAVTPAPQRELTTEEALDLIDWEGMEADAAMAGTEDMI